MNEPIQRLALDTAQLMRDHPSVLQDQNKRAVYDIACPPGSSHRAFGGNRVVMAALQVVVARLASVDRLIFHAVNPSGMQALRSGISVLKEELRAAPVVKVPRLIASVVDRGFEWGASDGN